MARSSEVGLLETILMLREPVDLNLGHHFGGDLVARIAFKADGHGQLSHVWIVWRTLPHAGHWVFTKGRQVRNGLERAPLVGAGMRTRPGGGRGLGSWLCV